jgi:hypothetical protein
MFLKIKSDFLDDSVEVISALLRATHVPIFDPEEDHSVFEIPNVNITRFLEIARTRFFFSRGLELYSFDEVFEAVSEKEVEK